MLTVVILEDTEGQRRQQQDGDQVDQGHRAHRQISEVPDVLQAGDSTEHDHAEHGEAVDHDDGLGVLLAGDVLDVGLAIGVVRDQRGEGEQQNGDRHEAATPATDL